MSWLQKNRDNPFHYQFDTKQEVILGFWLKQWAGSFYVSDVTSPSHLAWKTESFVSNNSKQLKPSKNVEEIQIFIAKLKLTVQMSPFPFVLTYSWMLTIRFVGWNWLKLWKGRNQNDLCKWPWVLDCFPFSFLRFWFRNTIKRMHFSLCFSFSLCFKLHVCAFCR